MMELTEIPGHEFAEIFTLRDDESLVKLADSIADPKIGQKVAIVLFQGKVLDGRRRQRACIMRGVAPLYREFGSNPLDGSGENDALEFAFAQYHNREASVPERALAAAKYATLKFGENRGGFRGKKGSSTERPSQAEAAKKFNVALATVKRAKKVLDDGTPELQEAYRSGKIKVSDAVAVADESPEVQRQAIAAVLEKRAKTAKGAIAAARPDPAAELLVIDRDIEKIINRVVTFNTGKNNLRSEACDLLSQARRIIARL